MKSIMALLIVLSTLFSPSSFAIDYCGVIKSINHSASMAEGEYQITLSGGVNGIVKDPFLLDIVKEVWLYKIPICIDPGMVNNLISKLERKDF